MRQWLLVRLGRAVVAAWGIASLVFLVSRVLPVSPEQLALIEMEDLSRQIGPATSNEVAASQQAVRQRLGLAAPLFYATRTTGPAGEWHWHGLHNQYHEWLSQVVRGNLGKSYLDGQPVTALLGQALAYSVPLAAGAASLATTLALALALYLARGSGSAGRTLVQASLATLQVVPLFLLALILLLLLANPAVINLMPLASHGPAPNLLVAAGRWAVRAALPLLSLVLAVLPALTLPLVASLRQESSTPYATTARAKGLPLGRVLRRHLLPNALLPLFTTLTDLLPTLVAGTVVVEVVFALPGSGRLLAEAAAAHDYPVVVAGVLLLAGVRLLSLIAADILYFLADPRLRPAT